MSLHSILLYSIPFHSTTFHPSPLHPIPLHPFHLFFSISLSPWLHSIHFTPFHDLGHVQLGVELCDLTSPSTSLKVHIYNHSCGNCKAMNHLPCVQYFFQHFVCLIPFNPHKALRCAYFSILLIQMRSLAYTVTRWHEPRHKTNGWQVCDLNSQVMIPAFPLIEKQTGSLCYLQDLLGESFQKGSMKLRQICREGIEAGALCVPALKLSKNQVATTWGQPYVI